MDIFQEITSKEWDDLVSKTGFNNVFMLSAWEQSMARELPFVSYSHWRYRDSHIVRVAEIDGRYTTSPFSEGSDVVSLNETPLGLHQLQTDLSVKFDSNVRLRINTRFAPVSDGVDEMIVAYEYVVDLNEPVLPRVRKTLRHILESPLSGQIKNQPTEVNISHAYKLYLRHMRRVQNFALPKKLFKSLIIDQKGELWVWTAGKQPDAAAIFIASGLEVLYSLSAANAVAFAANAPHHLVYQALLAYQAAGIKKVSLGSTGKGSALEIFKRGWRGKQYTIYELGQRSGVSRTSKVRSLVRYVPLAFYPLLTSVLGRRFL